MNWSLTTTVIFATGLIAAGCASSTVARRSSPPRATLDERVGVGGVVLVTNDVRISRQPLLRVTLFVTNITSAELYVPKHFNSNNYCFETPDVSAHEHGDSWGAAFEDFVLLKPSGSMKFTFTFIFGEKAGEGLLAVHFFNNLLPDVEQRLRATGIPFVVELQHSFGRISVRASNPVGAGNGGRAVLLQSVPCVATVPDQRRSQGRRG